MTIEPYSRRQMFLLIILMCLLLLLLFALLFGRGTAAEECPVVPLDEKTLTITEKINLWAFRYNVNNDSLMRVAICESNLNPLAVGDHGTSFGIFQYKKRTFEWLSEMSGIYGDIWDENTQIELTAFAFSKGYQNHWTCYKK